MAEEARVFFLRKRRERAEDTERRALLEGLGQTRSLIAQAYAGFNAAKDPSFWPIPASSSPIPKTRWPPSPNGWSTPTTRRSR